MRRVRMVRHRLAAACVLTAVLSACAPAPHLQPAAVQQKRVEFSILEDYDKGEDLAEVAKDFDLFRELGVSTWRGSFGWDDYEPSRGAYDFEWLHRFAALAASRGIMLRPYIAYTPAWAAAGGSDSDEWNDPPKNVEDWYRFVRALASEMRRHRNVVSYEIYNEQNVRQWWDGTPEEYDNVLRRGVEAVRAGNPDAEILLGGMVYPDLDWLESVCDEDGGGRLVDVIPFHAYPETWTPADVTVENYLGEGFPSRFVAPADAACGRKPIWINETGFATLPGRSEEDQARWWVRAVATFLAEPRIEHIGIYEIKDLRPDREAIGDAPNYHLGLTRMNRVKKKAFGAVRRLVSMLGGVPISLADRRMSLDTVPASARVYRHLFRTGEGRHVLFLWTREEGAVVTIKLPGVASLTEYGTDGAPRGRVDLEKGNAKIALRAGEVKFFEAAMAGSR